VADPGGANPAMPPIEVGNGVWPLGGRKSNGSIVNFSKSKDFGPPLQKIGHLKHEKGR